MRGFATVQKALDVCERKFALANAFIKVVDGRRAKVLANAFFGRTLVLFDFLQSKFADPNFFTQVQGLLHDAVFHPAAQFLFGLHGFHHFKPFGAGFLVRALEHLNGGSVFHDRIKVHHFVVNLRANAVQAKFGVNGKRKVQNNGPLRQFNRSALGGKHGHAGGFQVHLQEVEVFLGVRNFGLQLHHVVQPGQFFAFVLGFKLVGPVGGESLFGGQVHILGSNLDFDHLVFRTNHGGVNALVKVRLRGRDVVFKATLQGRPQVVDVAQSQVAFGNGFYNDADGENVEDVFELAATAKHLVVDTVNVFGTALNGAVEIFECHLDLQRANHRLDILFAGFLVLDEQVHQLLVFVGIYVLET